VLDVATGLLAGWVGVKAEGKAESRLQGWGERGGVGSPGGRFSPDVQRAVDLAVGTVRRVTG